MTGSLILDVILSVGIVLVIVGMLGWAVVADHRARVGSDSRAAASPPLTAPAASPSASPRATKRIHDRRRLGRGPIATSCGGQLAHLSKPGNNNIAPTVT